MPTSSWSLGEFDPDLQSIIASMTGVEGGPNMTSGFRDTRALYGLIEEIANSTCMLVEQAANSFSLWHGIEPDTAPVIAALR